MAMGPALMAAQPAAPTVVQNWQDQKEALQKTGTTETHNSGNLMLPASPCQVMARTVIAGALVSVVKSDLPSDVITMITKPIYDTATVKLLSIAQGTHILERYHGAS